MLGNLHIAGLIQEMIGWTTLNRPIMSHLDNVTYHTKKTVLQKYSLEALSCQFKFNPFPSVSNQFHPPKWIFTGWWYTYPSEQYEIVSWDDDIPNMMAIITIG